MKTNNILFIVFLTLLLIVVIKDSCNDKTIQNKTDTVYINIVEHITDTIIKKDFKPLRTKRESKIDSFKVKIDSSIKDTNYLKLIETYNKLKDSLYTSKIYRKTYKIDTFGTVIVEDSILNNNLISQTLNYDLKIPKQYIRITTKIPEKPKNEFYIGGGLIGNPKDILNGFELGIMFKNKKNKIYNIGLEKSLNSNILNYKIAHYIKL